MLTSRSFKESRLLSAPKSLVEKEVANMGRVSSSELVNIIAAIISATVSGIIAHIGDNVLGSRTKQSIIIVWSVYSLWPGEFMTRAFGAIVAARISPIGFPDRLVLAVAVWLVLQKLRPPTLDWIRHLGTDDEHLGRLMIGTAAIASYACTVGFLCNAVRIVRFMARLSVSPATIIIFTTTVFGYFCWKHIVDLRTRALFEQKLCLAWKPTRYFLIWVVVTVVESLSTVIKKLVHLFNNYEKTIIRKYESRGTNAESVPYQYPSREHKGRNIRLVRLSQRKLLTPLQCEIITVALDEAPLYEALSYAWNGEEFTERIALVQNGSYLPVTPTVLEFLQYRHSFQGATLFWIDAVCINQLDNGERSHQVTLMRDIYQRALRVVVWLGRRKATEDAYLARETLFHIVSQARSKTPEFFAEQLTASRPPGWFALARLFDHQWWTRVWIIQEVAVATTVHIMYGNICINWNQLAAALDVLSHPLLCGPAQMDLDLPGSPDWLARLRNRINSLSCALTINRIRATLQTNQRLTLSTALTLCAKSKSTDPKDRVYGLLGLVTEDVVEDLKPNYENTEAQTFMSATRHILLNNAPLRVFQTAGIGYPRSLDLTSLPSWAPDWSATDTGRFFEIKSIYDMDHISASKPGITFTDDAAVVKFTGFQVDIVRERTDIDCYGFDSGTPSIAAGYYQAKRLVEAYADNLYPTRDAAYHAFWCTLMCTETARKIYWPLNYDEQFARLEATDEVSQRTMTSEEIKNFKEVDSQFMFRMGECCSGKRFCVTEQGRFGLVPPLTKKGDLICFFAGMPMPFLLRKKPQSTSEGLEQRHYLVGGCYIHDLMGDDDDEVLDWKLYTLE